MKIPVNTKKKSSSINLESLIASAVHTAETYDEAIPVVSEDISPSGSSFKIDMLLPVGAETGDGRKFKEGALSARELPLPLLWQFRTASGHEQSVIIGRIDYLEITPEGIKNVRGVFDTNPYAREAERLIKNKFLRGVSADLDKFTATEDSPPESELSQKTSKEPKKIKNKDITIEEARLMGATVVALPAFQEAIIEIEENYVPSGITEGEYVDGVLEEYSMVASAAPMNPPHEWFKRYPADKPMPLTVEDNGRVYGYLALWSSNHIGMRPGTKPPRSSSNYQFFRTGVVRTDDGVDVTVGNITLVGGHASLQASAEEAVRHYDDTSSAVLDVVAGEDQFGIWLAGALRPDVTPSQIRALRASAISGDWRPINGRLELVGVCCVNVPGFPTTRTMVASGGQVTALVAAGSQDLWEMRTENTLRNDIDELRNAIFSIKAEAVKEKALNLFATDSWDNPADLANRAKKAMERMAELSSDNNTELSERVAELQREFYA